MNTYTKTIVALAAVVAISAILVASTLTSDAMACRHRGHSSHNSQSLAQGAVANGNNNKVQNVATQQQGDSNSAVTIGSQ